MHHIEDINSVAEGMSILLKDDGVIITEDPSLLEMIKKFLRPDLCRTYVYMVTGIYEFFI